MGSCRLFETTNINVDTCRPFYDVYLVFFICTVCLELVGSTTIAQPLYLVDFPNMYRVIKS